MTDDLKSKLKSQAASELVIGSEEHTIDLTSSRMSNVIIES